MSNRIERFWLAALVIAAGLTIGCRSTDKITGPPPEMQPADYGASLPTGVSTGAASAESNAPHIAPVGEPTLARTSIPTAAPPSNPVATGAREVGVFEPSGATSSFGRTPWRTSGKAPACSDGCCP